MSTPQEFKAAMLKELRGTPPPAPKPQPKTATVTADEARDFATAVANEERTRLENLQRQEGLHRSLDNLVSTVAYADDPEELVATFRSIASVSPQHAQAFAAELALHHPDTATRVAAEVQLAYDLHAQREAERAAVEAQRQRAEQEATRLFNAADRHGTSWEATEEAMNATGLEPEQAARVAAATDRVQSVTAWKQTFADESFAKRTRPQYDANGNVLREPVKLDPAHSVRKMSALVDAQNSGEAPRLNQSADELKSAIVAPTPADVEMRESLGRPPHVAEVSRRREPETDRPNTGPRLII